MSQVNAVCSFETRNRWIEQWCGRCLVTGKHPTSNSQSLPHFLIPLRYQTRILFNPCSSDAHLCWAWISLYNTNLSCVTNWPLASCVLFIYFKATDFFHPGILEAMHVLMFLCLQVFYIYIRFSDRSRYTPWHQWIKTELDRNNSGS